VLEQAAITKHPVDLATATAKRPVSNASLRDLSQLRSRPTAIGLSQQSDFYARRHLRVVASLKIQPQTPILIFTFFFRARSEFWLPSRTVNCPAGPRRVSSTPYVCRATSTACRTSFLRTLSGWEVLEQVRSKMWILEASGPHPGYAL